MIYNFLTVCPARLSQNSFLLKIFYMKILFMTVLTQFFALYVWSQTSIRNTNWMVHTEVPQSRDLILDFKKDTLRISNEQGGKSKNPTKQLNNQHDKQLT